MRTIPTLAAAACICLAGAQEVSAQQIRASAAVVATATFAPRPSLVVSTRVLRFLVEPGTTQAEAVVDFTAGMRAHPGTDVVLTVEAESSIDGPGGAADVETSLTFTGDGPGVQTGLLESTGASVAARWTGGGQRQGRLIFTLRASAPGVYSVPVRYLLGTP
jgi:hypothetical protein